MKNNWMKWVEGILLGLAVGVAVVLLGYVVPLLIGVGLLGGKW